jgi:hypothetical protein
MLELLASHYGTQLAETEGQAEAKNDIDSASFDADAYTRELLTDKSLPDLVAFQETLAKKARSLDSSMQNLVYENYNKFIRATETIREMRDSVGDLEAEMDTLRTMVEKTGTTSSRLNTSLASNRSRIEQLVGVRGLIGKLEFLFQLPARLRSCLELGTYQQAVKYYRAASRVLRSHSSVESFAAIGREADAIAEQLKTILRKPLEEPAARASDVAESTRLLILLGEPSRELLAGFLTWHRRRLSAALTAAVGTVSAAAAQGKASAGQRGSGVHAGAMREAVSASLQRPHVREPTRVVDYMNRVFTGAFVRTAKAFTGLRELAEREADEVAAARRRRRRRRRGMRGDEDDDDAERLGGADGEDEEDSDDGAAGSAAAAAASASAESVAERKAALASLSEELVEFAEESFGAYFTAIRTAMSRVDVLGQLLHAASEGSAAEGSAAWESVTSLGEGVVAAVERMLVAVRQPAKLVERAGLTDKAETTAVTVLRETIHMVFEAMKHVLCARMGAAVAANDASGAFSPTGSASSGVLVGIEAGKRLRAAGTDLGQGAVTLLRAALAVSRPLMLGGMRLLPDYARGFPGMLHGNALSTVLWVAAVCEATSEHALQQPSSHIQVAAVAAAAAVLEREGLAAVTDDGSAPSVRLSSPVVLRAIVAAAVSLPRLPRVIAAVNALASASTGAASENLGPGGSWIPTHAPVCAGQATPSMRALRSAARHRSHVGLTDAEIAMMQVAAALPTLGRPASGGSAAVKAAQPSLVMACLAESLGGSGSRACLEALSQAYPTRAELMSVGGATSEDELEAQAALTGDAMGVQERELAQQALVAAARLAEGAGTAAGRKIELILARSARTADWSAMKEPRAARPAAQLAVRETVALWAVLQGVQSSAGKAEAAMAAGGVASRSTSQGLIVGAAPRMPEAAEAEAGEGAEPGEGASGVEGAEGGGRPLGGLESDLDRLFASEGGGSGAGGSRRMEWEDVGAIPLAAEPVVSCAMRAAVWGLAECLRSVDDLGEHGFAQAQADVATLSAGAAAMLQGSRWRSAVEVALGEGLASAADRAPAGSALGPAIVAVAVRDTLDSMGMPPPGEPLRTSKPAPAPAAPDGSAGIQEDAEAQDVAPADAAGAASGPDEGEISLEAMGFGQD